jgi:hypothetical protein
VGGSDGEGEGRMKGPASALNPRQKIAAHTHKVVASITSDAWAKRRAIRGDFSIRVTAAFEISQGADSGAAGVRRASELPGGGARGEGKVEPGVSGIDSSSRRASRECRGAPATSGYR